MVDALVTGGEFVTDTGAGQPDYITLKKLNTNIADD